MGNQRSRKPQPHLVLHPPPWEVANAVLPYEFTAAPDAASCRHCLRVERKQDRDIAAARVALVELEKLLERMRREVGRNERLRERALRERATLAEEVSTLRALLEEYELLASETDTALEIGSKRVRVARARLRRSRLELKAAQSASEIGVDRDRVTEFESSLARERTQVEKWARYAAALEGRLREVGEAVEPQTESHTLESEPLRRRRS